MPTLAPVIVLAGPTASGKSRLALALASLHPSVVINADSMQVYRELCVLTARPGPEGLAAAPHRLYGFRSIAEPCSAGVWAGLAEQEIAQARSAGRLALVVGGTGLYLRSLMRGLAPVPEIPAGLRDDIRRRMRAHGPAVLHGELARRDPPMAARLATGDAQRIQRALEVLEHTGRSLLDWQEQCRAAGEPDWRAFVLAPPRPALYAACDARFARMLAQGALAEVHSLQVFDPALPGMKAVGVPEISAHLRGELTLEEAIEKARTATRRYAKRQTTWFRHQLPEAARIEVLIDSEAAALTLGKRILAEIGPASLSEE